MTHQPEELILYDEFADGIERNKAVLDMWEKYITERGMINDDFFYNCILAILDKSYYLNKSKIKKIDVMTSFEKESIDITYEKLNIRQKAVHDTKAMLKTDTDDPNCCDGRVYLEEFGLLFIDDVIYDDNEKVKKHTIPLLKLAKYQNIDNHNFTSDDICDMINYYNCIYNKIESNDKLERMEKILVLYHLELEMRFETVFSLLENLRRNKIKDNDKLDTARGFCKVLKVNSPTASENSNKEEISYYIQNRVFFGIKGYVDDYCYIAERYNADACFIVIRNMIDISICINAIVDIISTKELDNKVNYNCNFVMKLIAKAHDVHNSSKKAENIRVTDFINMYRPDGWEGKE